MPARRRSARAGGPWQPAVSTAQPRSGTSISITPPADSRHPFELVINSAGTSPQEWRTDRTDCRDRQIPRPASEGSSPTDDPEHVMNRDPVHGPRKSSAYSPARSRKMTTRLRKRHQRPQPPSAPAHAPNFPFCAASMTMLCYLLAVHSGGSRAVQPRQPSANCRVDEDLARLNR